MNLESRSLLAVANKSRKKGNRGSIQNKSQYKDQPRLITVLIGRSKFESSFYKKDVKLHTSTQKACFKKLIT